MAVLFPSGCGRTTVLVYNWCGFWSKASKEVIAVEFGDQEAPQEDAQEEAQEAAQEDSLAAQEQVTPAGPEPAGKPAAHAPSLTRAPEM
jgi:predicted Fe-S protein YdhL (DUF1289 family)